MNDPRDAFLEIYQSKIKRAGSEELLEWLTSSDFFTAPASTRYHGSFEGGLVTHSVNVYRCLAEELELSGLFDEKFPCGHGEKSVIILQNFIHLSAEEIFAIRAHMGGFDTSVKGGDYFIGKIFEKSKLALLLHVADMKATYLLEG